MKTQPLYRITYPAGYYALENTVTGRVIRTGYDTLDLPQSFIESKYKKALAKTVKVKINKK